MSSTGPRPEALAALVERLRRAIEAAYTGSAEHGAFFRYGGGEYVPSPFMTLNELEAALRANTGDQSVTAGDIQEMIREVNERVPLSGGARVTLADLLDDAEARPPQELCAGGLSSKLVTPAAPSLDVLHEVCIDYNHVRAKYDELDLMLRDLRECGANRGEPCGVHERPQWTCAFCLHNLLAEVDRLRALHAVTEGTLRALVERVLNFTRHKPACTYRAAYVDDSGCGMEDMSNPIEYQARPCTCGLSQAVTDLAALLPARPDGTQET